MLNIISPLLKRTAFVLSLSLIALPANGQEPHLTLKQAVIIALDRDDPSITHYTALAESKKASSIGESQLPDPVVKFGVSNIAADSFDFGQEAMTQMQFGVHQSFVSSTKRQLVRQRGQAGSDAYRSMAAKRALIIELEVGRMWLTIQHTKQVLSIVQEKKARLMDMHMAHEAKFESGAATAHQIFVMEAELALLDDKTESLEQVMSRGRVELARYIGPENASKPLRGSYGDVPMPQALMDIEAGLGFHPDIVQEKSMILASEKSVSLANENYKPNWGVDIGYGARAGGRSDMVTAMVTLDVPLFTGKRQDKHLLAAKKSKQAAQLKMYAKEMDMLRNLRSAYVVWQKSSKRIDLYNTVVLARSKAAREASENAYATNSTSFPEIIRAHLSELDVSMMLEKIKLERALAQVELQYFGGKTS